MRNKWRKVKLGDLGGFRNGVNFSKDKKGEGLGLINVKDLFNDGPYINFQALDKVDLSSKKGIENYHVKKGDVFFSRSSVKREGVGVVSLAKQASSQVVHCGFVIRFRPTSLDANPLYLTYLLRSDYYRQVIIGISGGSAIINVSQDTLSSLEVPLPPLPTQHKIAAILSAYDDLIENNNRRIEILEEMARMLYREWFVKFRYPGHESDRFYESELGLIPEGWEVVRLSSLVKTQYGYTESACEEPIGPKYVRGKDINKTSYIQWDLVPYCPISEDNYEKYKLKTRDILVIRMADPGKVGIVEQEVDAVFASYLIRLSINEDSNLKPYYLFYFLNSDNYQDYITGASTGTTRKSASAGVLTDVSVVLPPRAVQKRFEDNVLNFRKMINSLLKKNNNLRQTRDLLLPRLISGEIDVENLDIKVIDN